MDATPGGEFAEGEASGSAPGPQEPVEEHISLPSAATVDEAARVETVAEGTVPEVIPAQEGPVSQDVLEDRPALTPTTEVGEAPGI